ncbi:MAG: zinc ribbon domain-containing protein [Candidatus Humimicrobiaceae bacterium]
MEKNIEKNRTACKCPYCDAELKSQDNDYCSYCKIKIYHCDNCGNPVSSNIDICPKCGKKL